MNDQPTNMWPSLPRQTLKASHSDGHAGAADDAWASWQVNTARALNSRG